MLKRFGIKEELESSQEISSKIDAIVDKWVSDLTSGLVNNPMDFSKRASLWDRMKGTLSNIWHGKYNPKNPNYWKNRFGDELGSQEESYDPSVFSLQEYTQIKSIIENAERQLNEAIPTGSEKLTLVRVLKNAAEKLKKDLKTALVSVGAMLNTSAETSRKSTEFPAGLSGWRPKAPVASNNSEQRPRSIVDTNPSLKPMGRHPEQDDDTDSDTDSVEDDDISDDSSASANAYDTSGRDDYNDLNNNDLKNDIDNDANDDGPTAEEPKPIHKNTHYDRHIPKKENEGMSAESLADEGQLVDLIMAKDFDFRKYFVKEDETVKSAAERKLTQLEELEKEASEKKESKYVLNRINKAIEIIREVK